MVDGASSGTFDGGVFDVSTTHHPHYVSMGTEHAAGMIPDDDDEDGCSQYCRVLSAACWLLFCCWIFSQGAF